MGMIKNFKFYFIVILTSLSLPILGFGAELDFQNNHYFYHWASANRAHMLLKFGAITEKNWPSVVGTSRNETKNGTAFGTGLYLSASPSDAKSFGTDLVIVEVPKDSPTKSICLKTERRWLLVEKPDTRIRFFSAKRFFNDLLVENQIVKMNTLDILEMALLLKDKGDKNIPDVYAEFKQKMFETNAINKTWFEDYFELGFRRGSFVLQDSVKNKFIDLTSEIPNPEVYSDPLIPEFIPENLRYNLSYGSKFQKQTLAQNLLHLAARFFDREHFEVLTVQAGLTLSKSLSLAAGDSGFVLKNFKFDLYGKEAFNAWMYAYHAVEKSSLKGLPTYEDFLWIHKIVYPESVGSFRAYENAPLEVKSQSNYNPRGQLRNGPIYITGNTS
jgi:hypothetical protein